MKDSLLLFDRDLILIPNVEKQFLKFVLNTEHMYDKLINGLYITIDAS
jgi:hypothetical protein